MTRFFSIMVLVCMPFLYSPVWAQDGATIEEVYDLILNAVPIMEELGEEGLDAFKDPHGEFVYKNAYVLVIDCGKMKMAAHPIAKFVGLDLSNQMDMNPDVSKRKNQNIETCEMAKRPNGGWIEYWWTKPNSDEVARKVGFVIGIPGSDYALVSAIYDDTADIDELNASLQ